MKKSSIFLSFLFSCLSLAMNANAAPKASDTKKVKDCNAEALLGQAAADNVVTVIDSALRQIESRLHLKSVLGPELEFEASDTDLAELSLELTNLKNEILSNSSIDLEYANRAAHDLAHSVSLAVTVKATDLTIQNLEVRDSVQYPSGPRAREVLRGWPEDDWSLK